MKMAGREFVREKVRARDNWTCQDCGIRRGLEEVLRHNLFHKELKGKMKGLDVHHLNGKCGLLSKAYDKMEDIEGLITLCHKCHYNRPEHKCKSAKWSEISRGYLIKVPRSIYSQIFSQRAKGMKIREIGKNFGVSYQRIQQILANKN